MAYLLVAIAASLWGIVGIFTKAITAAGFNPLEMSLVRAFLSAVLMGMICIAKDRNSLRLEKIGDIKDFILISVFGFCGYNVFYIMAINEIGVSVAGALFYTYPTFVLILSRIVFQEKITLKRIGVILLTFLGCACVSGAIGGDIHFSGKGIIYGVISAFSFAFYSVLGKFSAVKYDTGTINFYIFLVAFVIFLFIGNPISTTIKVIETNTFMLMLTFTVMISILPYICYLRGLSQLDVGKATVITTLEPIVAAMLGVFAFQESMTAIKWTGIILIIGAVCFMNSKIGEPTLVAEHTEQKRDEI